MKIVTIRHGETDVNASGLIQGRRTDVPLNENGREQARKAAVKLPADIDIIISSPLVRATQTAQIINERYEKEVMLVDNRLIERDFGKFEGEGLDDMNVCVDIEEFPFDTLTIVQENSSPAEIREKVDINALRRYTDNIPTPGGETMREVTARVFGFLDNAITKYNGKNLLLCTHGHVIRPIIWYFNGLPAEGDEEVITTPNCGFYEFEITPELTQRAASTKDESEDHEGFLYGTLKLEFTLKDGSIYQGGWQDGYRMQGHGKWTYPDGTYYDGEWVKGVRCGYGVFMYPDGENYEGEWKDNVRHGYGKYTYVSGKVWEGEWVDDKFTGRKET